MPLFVTVSRGPRADQARPILASADRAVVAAVLAAIVRLDDGSSEVSDEGGRHNEHDWGGVLREVTDGCPV